MLLLSGLSVLVRPKRWVEFLRDVYILKKKSLSVLTISTAAISLPLGLALVVAHNTWTLSSSVIVTVVAWAILVKQVFFLFFPEAMKVLDIFHRKTDSFLCWFFRIAGGIYIVLGVWVLFPYWF